LCLQQITEWFKKLRRKLQKTSSHPKPIINLTGKVTRKPIPLQLHQAYSSRYCQPGTPLYDKVEDLWNRCEDPGIIAIISPHTVGESDFKKHLLYHNAVMRWKCSTLSKDKKEDLEVWVNQNILERWDAILHPWRDPLNKEVSELTAKNKYIQE
jgi:hypothetical protein